MNSNPYLQNVRRTLERGLKAAQKDDYDNYMDLFQNALDELERAGQINEAGCEKLQQDHKEDLITLSNALYMTEGEDLREVPSRILELIDSLQRHYPDEIVAMAKNIIEMLDDSKRFTTGLTSAELEAFELASRIMKDEVKE